jgi:hypothetical protein
MSQSSTSPPYKKKFCRFRRPYQTHRDVDLAPFLVRLHDGESTRSVARSSNIRRSTLQRLYKRWKALSYPQPYIVQETRGRKLTLNVQQETFLANICDEYIQKGYILHNKHVRNFAKMIAASGHYYDTRR